MTQIVRPIERSSYGYVALLLSVALSTASFSVGQEKYITRSRKEAAHKAEEIKSLLAESGKHSPQVLQTCPLRLTPFRFFIMR
jgi:hypothetical protein